MDPLRIALVAAPMLPVPPPAYAGTERIVATLATQLHERGHEVTVFASGDSRLPCRLVPVVPRALWPTGYRGDVSAYVALAVAAAWREADRFDLIHSHVDAGGFLFARHCPTPILSTLHGRLDRDGRPELLAAFPDIPLVAISDSQREASPHANWVATIYHGLDFEGTPSSDVPGSYLLVVGRAAPEKGIREAISLAQESGLPLVMALKVHDPAEHDLYEEVIAPAITAGHVDWRGEVRPAERDRLMAGALATLMLGSWPEPFGLVAIESMATGTPVIGRPDGALTETIDDGLTGFVVDSLDEAVDAVRRVGTLDRRLICARTRTRFSADRMVTEYEDVYRQLVTSRRPGTRRHEAPEPAYTADRS